MRSPMPERARLVSTLLCLAAATVTVRADEARHPFSVRDMVAMERLASPQPSPDGSRVVFTRRTYDGQTNKTFTNLWIVPIDGGEPQRLTSARGSDTAPRFSPDGRTIAFISDRGGSSQVWGIDLAGGEARPITSLPLDLDNVRWSPDGTRLAFSAEVYPDCPDLACTAKRDKEKSDNPVKARVYDRLMIRHWDAWNEGKRNHIFVLPVKGGEPVDVMKGADADAPTKPFGGTEEFDWSPDGRSIAFTSKMTKNEAWSTDNNVYLAAADGSGYRCLTCVNEATDTAPA